MVIKKYGRDVKEFDVEKLARETKQFTGAEIDNAFKDAMFTAFSNNEEVTMKHLVAELSEVIPQAVTNEAKISEMRDKADGRLKKARVKNKVDDFIAETRKVKA